MKFLRAQRRLLLLVWLAKIIKATRQSLERSKSDPSRGLLRALWNIPISDCHLYCICFTSHPTCHWSFNPRIRVLRNSHNQQSWEEQIFQIFTLIAIFRVSAAAGSVGPRVITLPGPRYGCHVPRYMWCEMWHIPITRDHQLWGTHCPGRTDGKPVCRLLTPSSQCPQQSC